MSDAPENIWAYAGAFKMWRETYPASRNPTEYVRADVAQAMVAAAYEVAAYECAGSNRGLTVEDVADDIRALTPIDARAALDAMLAKAREEREMFAWAMEAVAKAREDALREALQRIADLKRGHSEDVDEGQEQAYRAIEALIDRTAEDAS